MLLDPDAIDACIGDYRERPPAQGTTYVGFADPSGGRGDGTTVAVSHAEGERIIVDAVRAWRGDIAAVAGEMVVAHAGARGLAARRNGLGAADGAGHQSWTAGVNRPAV